MTAPFSADVPRRVALKTGAAWLVASRTPWAAYAKPRPDPQKDAESPQTGLGLVIYCQRYLRERKQQQRSVDLFEPQRFLKHCQQLGAGGMQIGLSSLAPADAKSLRETAERAGFFIEAIVRAPENDSDLPRFDAEMQTAQQCGARAARTVIFPGRRYERFQSLAEYKEFARLGQAKLERAAPIAEKYRLPLAVENHKDQRIDERVALFKRIDSEYVGACVDTGNSLALLEDPQEIVAALSPWAFSVHLKDQAVQEYVDGFLLADIPLGKGIFDLQKMVATLRKVRPDIRFSLELITRDPLKVPCLHESYWATFPQLPAKDLARTLRTVKARASATLPRVESLPLDQRVAVETAHVRASLDYAANVLRI